MAIKDVDPRDLRVNDLILQLDEFTLAEPIKVLQPADDGAILESTAQGIQRILYYDQYQKISILRDGPIEPKEVLLPPEAHEIISDSLLLMRERLARQGLDVTRVCQIQRALHSFTSPDTEVDVIVRPRTS